MKPKSVSLWVIILSGVWVAVLALAKAMFPAVTGSELGLGVPEIIATGVFFVIIFTPVYRSIWLDKQLGAKMEEAKMNNANTDKLVEFVTTALKSSANTEELRTQNEINLGAYLHQLADKNKTSGETDGDGGQVQAENAENAKAEGV